MFVGLIASRVILGNSIELIVGVIVLWTLAMFFWRASQLASALYLSPNLTVYSNLPISDDNIFAIQSKLFLRVSFWSALDFAICYWALTSKSGIGASAILAGIGLGLIHWVFIVAASVVLFAFGPNRFFPLLGQLFGAGTVCFAFFGSLQPALSDWLMHMAHWIPPVGWILLGLGVTPTAGFVHDFTPAVIGSFVLCLAPLAYRNVKRHYALTGELFFWRTPIHLGGERASAQQATETIRSRQFLGAFAWPKVGLVERLLSRVLTDREKTIAEFMVAANPRWTKSLRFFLIVWVLMVFGFLLFSSLLRSGNGLFIYLGFYLVYFFYSNLAGGWMGFFCPAGLGLQSPIFAHYPIGFWELVRTMLKINLGRVLLYLPVMVAVVLGISLALGKLGFMISVVQWSAPKLAFLLFCVQPLLIVVPISPATNDTKELRFAVLAVIGFLLLLGSGITFFLVHDWKMLLISGTLTAAIPIAGLFWYGRMFNQNKIDLVPLAKNDGNSP